MAPKKAPKKPLESMEKHTAKPVSKIKKSKKKSYQNFSIYIYKLLKNITENKIGISRKSMLIMNHFVHDMLENIASEAGSLAARSKKNTLTSRDMQAAVKLLIPGELGKHSQIEALKAVNLYHKSQ